MPDLKSILGAGYNPDTDDASPRLNAVLAERGAVITDPDGLTVRCKSPLKINTGARLLLAPATTLLKGFSGAPLIVNGASLIEDVIIQGGRTVGGSNATGKAMELYGNGITLADLTLTEFWGGQGIVWGGDDNRFHRVTAKTSEKRAGNGAFRMIWGSGFLGTELEAECYDDVFQFVPSTDPANRFFGASITRSQYIDCYGISHGARLMIAAYAGPQNTHQCKGDIHDVGWLRVNGVAGNRAITIENSEGDGHANQIDNVWAIDCHVDCSQQNANSTQDVFLQADRAGSLHRVTLSQLVLTGQERAYGITAKASGMELLLAASQVGVVQKVSGTITVTPTPAQDPRPEGMRIGWTAPTTDPEPEPEPTPDPEPTPTDPTVAELQARIADLEEQLAVARDKLARITAITQEA